MKRQVISIEGNGSRPSHKGIGYSMEDVMYTLNSTEVHCVAYEVYGFDAYNFSLTMDKGRCLNTPSGGLNEHIPCIIIKKHEK